MGGPISVLGTRDPYLVSNAGDEGLDVQLGGAALLTGSVGTLQAAECLLQGCPLAQSGVLDVLKVLLEI